MKNKNTAHTTEGWRERFRDKFSEFFTNSRQVTSGHWEETIKSFISQEIDRAREEVIEDKIYAVDMIMMMINSMTLDRKNKRRVAKLADDLTGKDRAKIYKRDSLKQKI